MATRLRNLRVDECSVVDRAACPQAKVLILKNQEGTAMSFAQTLFSKRASGAITDFDGAIAIQKRAKELGVSLSKYLDTEEGRDANNAVIRARYFEQQCQSAAGNGHDGFNKAAAARPFQKQNYYTESASDEDAPVGWSQQTNSSDKPVPHGDHSQDGYDKFQQAVQRCMDEEKCSHDEAATRMHRSEKLQKRQQW